MERDSVAFRIDHHSTKSVLADLLSRAQDFPTVLSRGFDRFIQPALNQQINQRSICGRGVIDASAIAANAKTTGGVLFFVRQQTVIHSSVGQPLHSFAKHGGIKFDRAIEIHDRNVGPAKCVRGHSYFIT